MILVTKPKPNEVVTKFLWYGAIFRSEVGITVEKTAAGSSQSWTAVKFHNLLVPKAPKQALLFMDGCQIIVVERRIQSKNILFGHLADFTPFYVHFKACYQLLRT